MSYPFGEGARCLLCANGLCSDVSFTEDESCNSCGSTWRAQSVMRGVLLGLGYAEYVDINEISTDLSRTGLGIGDDWRLARMLSQKFAYTNSFLHKFPQVDLLDPPTSCFEQFEFVTCSDVLEHTPPPRTRPIQGIYQMLKPGGFTIITVPIKSNVSFKEYYPNLVSWEVLNSTIRWQDTVGLSFVDNEPEFHGGEGLTLVFRQWSKKQLGEDLSLLGFSQVLFLPGKGFEHSDKDVALVIARK